MTEETKPAEETSGLTTRWIEPGTLRASWDAGSGTLTVRLGDGDPIRGIHIAPLCPISRPGTFLEFSNDKKEKLGSLKSLEGLDGDTRSALETALMSRNMIPRLTRVIEIVESASQALYWRVETDRGPRAFHTDATREAAKHTGQDRIRLKDLAGNLYDLTDISMMDAGSRAILEGYF